MSETEKQTEETTTNNATEAAPEETAKPVAEVKAEAASPEPAAAPAQAAEPASEVAPPAEEPTNGATAGTAEPASEDDGPSAAPQLPEDELSFAELFALAEKQSKTQPKRSTGGIRPGRIVEAKVVGFSHDAIFVDMGGKAEGLITKADFLDGDGNLTVSEGDSIEARVISVEGGQVKLGKAVGADSAKNREAVRLAFEAGLPIEGKVTGSNKGGLEVEVGGLRAFCPISQIDLRFCNDPTQFLGQKLVFKISEFKNNGRNVVISRRSILEEEKQKKVAELVGKLEVGQVMIGKVTTLKDYGAFVDIGGMEGLVHISEITHEHIKKPKEKLSIGEEMSVKILKIEDGKGGNKKISLSIKALADDPWKAAEAAFKNGQKVRGRVQRIQDFGVFVEIMPGIDGLIHVSNLSNERVKNPRDLVKEGDEVDATIIALDWKKRRIGLSLVKTRQELAGELGSGQVVDGTVEKIEGFGLFVKLESGARGLVPSAETGTTRGSDLTKEFKVGQKIKVSILEAEKKSGKIRLSIRRVAEAEERALYTNYMSDSGASAGLGTFADLFRDKLK